MSQDPQKQQNTGENLVTKPQTPSPHQSTDPHPINSHNADIFNNTTSQSNTPNNISHNNTSHNYNSHNAKTHNNMPHTNSTNDANSINAIISESSTRERVLNAKTSSSSSITSETPFLGDRPGPSDQKRRFEIGKGKRERTFKKIRKGINVENIHEWVWYKNMVLFTTWLTTLNSFRTGILVTLSINLILIAVMSNPVLIPQYGAIFELVDLFFLVIYTAEFFLKLLSGPKHFWKEGFNRFDFFILVISYLQVANLGAYGVASSLYFLRVFRALRALRALRFISFVRDLQVLFSALLKTFRALAYVLTLLLIILYVGAVIAYHIYSTTQPDNPANPYSELLNGMLTLFCFVTADGWSNIQDDMDDVLGESSRVLTVIILFLGHFMYENLLAGLMIQYMTEADEEETKIRKQRKLEAINKKKAFISEQQQQDMASFGEKRTQMLKDQPELSYYELMTQLAGKISHNNIIPSTDLSCSQTWLELYTATLHHQEHNMYRLQQLHFEVAKTLAEVLERKLHAKIHM
eukprot:Phypoly_transcript_03731.p1 GENE.Phypoly_transcript_03731~~Phypoly_transcript_03731.p1  ORF type:complete len:522 (+),score=71.18 Phypoly_transcript_03731:711-2276(+)